jgi:hypothetical protein
MSRPVCMTALIIVGNDSMDARAALAIVFVGNASCLPRLLESKSRLGEGVEHPIDDRAYVLY